MSELAIKIREQGELVRKLKAEGGDISGALTLLKSLKAEAAQIAEVKMAESKAVAKRAADFQNLLVKKFFYCPAFEIYGGVGGLYDFGPPGCALKANILSEWRKHFVLTEKMLQIDCVNVTPKPVFVASGHVERFTDFMVEDVKTGDPYRADKLLEKTIDELLAANVYPDEEKNAMLADRSNADAFDEKALSAVLKKYNIKAPKTGNDLTEPKPFNLMFQTSIGPSGKHVGYLRPETAQGMFTNFKRLLEYNNGKVPFAAAQIGLGFRNEIAPRNGLIRVREFPMAEIEHFCHPNIKTHPKFDRVKDYKLSFLPAKNQTGEDQCIEMTIGEAVGTKMVDNETLGYFIVRTHQFMIKIGVDPAKLRFRQHKADEMAHYAADCWDCEIYISGDWEECVGIADRSAYDLEHHAAASKVDLSARLEYDEPRLIKVAKVKFNNKALATSYRKSQGALRKYMNTEMTSDVAERLLTEMANGGEAKLTCPDPKTSAPIDFVLTSDMVDIKIKEEKSFGEKFIPSVIEPAFGIGRCLYAVLEHSFTQRIKDGEQQDYLALKPSVAPYKVCVASMNSDEKSTAVADELEASLIASNLPSTVDMGSATPGRKYARADMVGIPFALMIDDETHTTQTVTIRERDSTNQIRVPTAQVADIILRLVTGSLTWEQAYETYPKFTRPSEE